jgi:type I restriction enzyme M protein
MITGEIKSKVDRIWDTLWAGGIANPLTIIEQLTYLLFIKRLDELHTLKENKANRLKKPIEDPIFTPKQDSIRWSRCKRSTEPLSHFCHSSGGYGIYATRLSIV